MSKIITAILVAAVSIGLSSDFTFASESHKQPVATAKRDRRKLQFPTGFPVGTVYLVPANNLDARLGEQTARGSLEFVVPAGHLLAFQCGTNIRKDPKLMGTLSLPAIDILRVSFYSVEEETTSLCDPILNYLPQFPNLQRLVVIQSDSTDAGVSHVKGLAKLKDLNLFQSNIRGQCFQAFQDLPLERLDASCTSLDCANLAYLGKLPHLTDLNLTRTGLNNKALILLSKCTHLRGLDLSENQGIDDSGMNSLVALKQLTQLSLFGTRITIDGLARLKPLKLNVLFLPPAIKSKADLATLTKLFPGCHFVPSAGPAAINADVKRIFAPLK